MEVSWKQRCFILVTNSTLQESLGNLVADKLRKSIWNKEIRFGERLIESELSKKFEVSRNTIRDALKILQYEELVIIQPRKGTYVADFSAEDWKEIIELRTIVEAYAFVKALVRIDDNDYRYLAHILQKMKTETTNKNWNQLFDLDLKFHSYVIHLCGNNRIIKLYDSILVQIRTFLIYLDTYYSSYESFYDEQNDLYQALLTKNPVLVDQKIRVHIMYVEGKLLGE